MQCMDTTDGVMALFRHLQRTAQDCGFGEIGYFQVGGLSDSGITVRRRPTVCGMGVRGEGNHTPDEYAGSRIAVPAQRAYGMRSVYAERRFCKGCRISGGIKRDKEVKTHGKQRETGGKQGKRSVSAHGWH